MLRSRNAQWNRRRFVALAGAAALAGSLGLVPQDALAGRKTLRIAKWAHFMPEFDVWFASVAADWGRQNDTLVTVDTIPGDKIAATARAEIKAGKGHDIFIFPSPPAEYYQHTIDHGGVYQAVAAKYGAIPQLAYRSTCNPRTGRYFAFTDFWMPAPVHFYQDQWADVGMPMGPVTYTDLRGRQPETARSVPGCLRTLFLTDAGGQRHPAHPVVRIPCLGDRFTR